jgi:DNA (cytosine-5)-methyltransferase 1
MGDMTTRNLPQTIDLFCGCGGLSAGARAAGFHVSAGLDVEPKYMASFTKNFPEARSIPADLTSFSPEELGATLKIRRGELDLLVGGPPCQGFSKNVPRRSRYMEDERNRLVLRFLRYSEWFRPRVILMENVAEMKNGFDQTYSDEIVDALSKVGYTVTHAVLNAADFGVPQRRRRAFFVAIAGSANLSLPMPTHSALAKHGDFFAPTPHVNVWDAISDLPALSHGEGAELTNYATAPMTAYQRWARGKSGAVTNHVARRLQPVQFERLSVLHPGQGLKDLPDHLKTRGGYSGAYGRLTKDMIAPTITRWVFHPGSGRWGHPVDTRTLTIREVARLQGFRDDFEFVGSFVQQAGQLGNAVPALLAEEIIRHVAGSAGLVGVQQSDKVLHRHAVNE